jgi:hypothetical protein
MFASKDTLLTRPSGGYTIARSVRLRSSASAYFNRTLTTPTNNKIWTYSCWFKRGSLTTYQGLFEAPSSGSTFGSIYLTNTDIISWYDANAGATVYILQTSQVFRDPSAWYHLVCVYDSTQATASNRQKMYVNGVQITAFATATYVAQNTNGRINSAVAHKIGTFDAAPSYYDGYLTEINFIDGQALTPSSFGSTNAITGVWQPAKYTGTYGTNGFYLNFSDNSNNTATTIGKDYSGNGNNWTPNNISVTAGATYDSMTDVPTVGATSSNYAVLNPLISASYQTLTNGNLSSQSNTSTDSGQVVSTIRTGTTGLWYAEFTANTSTAAGYPIIGTWDASLALPTGNGGSYTPGATGSTAHAGYMSGGNKLVNGSSTAFGTSYATGDVVGVAVDCTNGAIYFSKNNTWQNSGVPTSGSSKTGAATTWTGGAKDFYIALASYTSGNGADANFGQRPFSYTPPTGFVALNTYNLPDSTIKNGAGYMAATLYTGNSSTQTITNTVGSTSFKPDFVWIKNRTTASQHVLTDSVRGVTKQLFSSNTNTEQTSATGITSLNSNGFSLDTNVSPTGSTNSSPDTYVAWNWNTNGGSTSSNTNGSITSTVSAGATQGFSVVTYTGNGTNGATFGHGLGVAPSFVIVKERSNANGWLCYHISTGNTGYLELDATLSFQTLSTVWNNTTPSSSVVTLGTVSNVNRNGGTFVAYCFAAVAGYSAFGSYTGNGSTDGPFIYTGFRPRFFMYKRTDSAGSWVILDSSRNPSNVTTQYLYPNASDAEVAAVFVDFVSNGVKFRTTYTDTNGSGFSYIYACFAESPFKTSLAR